MAVNWAAMNNDPQSSVSDAKPSHEQIAIRAELLWKAQGSPAGRDEQIWLEAERQLFDEAREIIAAPARSPEPGTRSNSTPSSSKASEQMSGRKATPGASSKRRTSSGK